MSDYETFLRSKVLIAPTVGIDVSGDDLCPALFPFQRDLTRWALRKGRAALFLDTGLGKTICQLAWAQIVGERTGGDVLILAPLAVTRQTVAEGERFGIAVTACRSQSDVRRGINIANYEMLEHFDASSFIGVILDESSILKNFTGTTKRALIDAFRKTPYRLCCTATPAPNDTIELCNHADFLSIMDQQEMVSLFFTPKGNDGGAGSWRLKAHAAKSFYRWLASWSMALKRPSDLGYSDDGYNLPALSIEPIVIETTWAPPGQLFLTELKGVTERAAVRRETLAERVGRAVAAIAAEPEEQWLVWYGLIAEGESVAKGIPGAVMLRGSDSPDHKADTLDAFAAGRIRVLVTHPGIAGLGMNFQRCARLLFVGINDSYETYYQAVRRCWRFGQTRPVRAYIVITSAERVIYENVLRKEQQATALSSELIANMVDFERIEIVDPLARHVDYHAMAPAQLPAWLTPAKEEVAA